jgi:hypothetical protein
MRTHRSDVTTAPWVCCRGNFEKYEPPRVVGRVVQPAQHQHHNVVKGDVQSVSTTTKNDHPSISNSNTVVKAEIQSAQSTHACFPTNNIVETATPRAQRNAERQRRHKGGVGLASRHTIGASLPANHHWLKGNEPPSQGNGWRRRSLDRYRRTQTEGSSATAPTSRGRRREGRCTSTTGCTRGASALCETAQTCMGIMRGIMHIHMHMHIQRGGGGAPPSNHQLLFI